MSFVHWGFSKSFDQEADALEVDLPAIKYQYCVLPKHGKHNCHKQMLGEAPAIWYIMTRLFNCSTCWRFSARIWTLKLYDCARKFQKKKDGTPKERVSQMKNWKFSAQQSGHLSTIRWPP